MTICTIGIENARGSFREASVCMLRDMRVECHGRTTRMVSGELECAERESAMADADGWTYGR